MKALSGWAAAVVLVACGSGGSSSGGSSSGECADCGGCGIAGPVNVTAMEARTFGVDAAGRAAGRLNLAKAGECQGENQHASTLHVVDNNAIEVSPGFEALDDRTRTKRDTSTAGVTKWDWNDRDLSVTVENGGVSGLGLTFSSAGATLFRVKCLPVGETGSCTKE